jgi:hypothetical protein
MLDKNRALVYTHARLIFERKKVWLLLTAPPTCVSTPQDKNRDRACSEAVRSNQTKQIINI